MSKFFITNNKEISQKITKEISSSEFKLCFNTECDNIFAFATQKLKVPHTNSLKINNDFIITNGTLIYKEGNNIENWKQLYTDYNDNIKTIRQSSIGNYAICIKKGNTIDIWGEESGAFNIFYYNEKGSFLVSNSLYDVAKIIKEKISINELNVIEEAAQFTILGDETIFNEIKRLSGTQHINIHDNSFNIIEEKILYPILNIDIKKCASNVATILKQKANSIYNTLGNPGINMTGGLDARISLAAYLSVSSKPFLNYGIGNTGLTNTKDEDLRIDLLFQKKYGLDLRIGSWKTPTPLDRDWEYYISKYGFGAYVYSASADVMNYYENSQGNIMTFGFGGELYRNLPWIENRTKSYFNVDEFIDEYYITGDAKLMTQDIPNYREHIKKKIIKLCERYNLNPNHIDNVDNFYLLIEYRKTADSKTLNLVNMMKFSNLLLLEKECLENARVNIENMKQSKFMLQIINSLNQEVLDIPIFSHCQSRVYDKKSESLLPEHKPLKTSIKQNIKHITPLIVLNQLKKVGKNKHTTKNNKILTFLKQYLKSNPYNILSEACLEKISYLPKISKYALNLAIIRSIYGPKIEN